MEQSGRACSLGSKHVWGNGSAAEGLLCSDDIGVCWDSHNPVQIMWNRVNGGVAQCQPGVWKTWPPWSYQLRESQAGVSAGAPGKIDGASCL